MADLFVGAASDRRTPRRIIATYVYQRSDGTVAGRKVRYEPKAFRWTEHCDDVGLYRLPDLIGVTRVFVVEGEKAVDALWARGLPATCGPAGAGTWRDAWSGVLWERGCLEVVSIADNDKPGECHSEIVAGNSYSTANDRGIVKTVRLPGLCDGGDVVDYFSAGGTVEGLLKVVNSTPIWTPTLRSEERKQRQRALRQARNRRYRDKQRASRQAETGRTSLECTETLRTSGTETARRETPANVPLDTSQEDSIDPLLVTGNDGATKTGDEHTGS